MKRVCPVVVRSEVLRIDADCLTVVDDGLITVCFAIVDRCSLHIGHEVLWGEPDGLVGVGHRSVKVSHVAEYVASVDVETRFPWTQPNRLSEFGQGLRVITLALVNLTANSMRVGVLWVKLQGLVDVGQGRVSLVLVEIRFVHGQ